MWLLLFLETLKPQLICHQVMLEIIATIYVPVMHISIYNPVTGEENVSFHMTMTQLHAIF